MVYLLLSILCSSLIFLIFRAFKSYGVSNFPAIVVNYLVAGITGFFVHQKSISIEELVQAHWFPYALVLGLVFISLFNIMALTAQRFGASVASIANKMALIVPVLVAVYLYDESLHLIRVAGIVLAILAVYFSTVKEKNTQEKHPLKLYIIPLILFLGSGFIDTFLNYAEVKLLSSPEESRMFTSVTFLTAFSLGCLALLFRKDRKEIDAKTILGGSLLGIINYGSIYFLLQAISTAKLESGVLFPINNLSVVLLTTGLSALVFKEQFSRQNKWGVFLAVLSILILSFAA